MRTLKYIWQDYKTKEYNLPEIKINPVVNKILNYRSKWVQHLWRMDRQTATINYEISVMWEETKEDP